MSWTATVSLDAFAEFRCRAGNSIDLEGRDIHATYLQNYFHTLYPFPTDEKVPWLCVCVSLRAGFKDAKSLACVATVIKMAITDSAGDHVLPNWRTLI